MKNHLRATASEHAGPGTKKETWLGPSSCFLNRFYGSFWYVGTVWTCTQKRKQGPGGNALQPPGKMLCLLVVPTSYLVCALLFASLQNTEKVHITNTTTHDHCANNVHHFSKYLKSWYDMGLTRMWQDCYSTMTPPPLSLTPPNHLGGRDLDQICAFARV